VFDATSGCLRDVSKFVDSFVEKWAIDCNSTVFVHTFAFYDGMTHGPGYKEIATNSGPFSRTLFPLTYGTPLSDSFSTRSNEQQAAAREKSLHHPEVAGTFLRAEGGPGLLHGLMRGCLVRPDGGG
jgi:hypothetical protein